MAKAAQPIVMQVAGRRLEIWPRVSARANRVRLAVKPGPRIELSYPEHTAPSVALDFLKQHTVWLEKVMTKTRTVQPSILQHFEKFPWATLNDRIVAITMASATRAKIKIQSASDDVTFFLPDEDKESAAVRVTRRLAETGLSLAVERLSQRVGVSVGSVSVRDQTTRWGSCSQVGTLSLNWRLVLLPPLLHDHVILHELAHRVNMDHSDKFWRQLARWDPEWKAHDRELTKRWNNLMDLGRA
jgi:predicted metal-dependent hydrolase